MTGFLLVLGLFLLVVGFIIGGYLTGKHLLTSLLFCFAGLVGTILLIGGIVDSTHQYYKERVPNVQQYLDDYEVNELEKKIASIKKGAEIETND